jgi:hypothetical protein
MHRLINVFSILVVVVVIGLIGCKNQPTDTNGDLEEPVISKTIGANGGVLSIVNNDGDEIELLIPARAIEDSTEITLTALNELDNDIFVNNLSFGILLEPAGLMFDEPATLIINFANDLPDTTSATLFNLIEDSKAFPLGSRKVSTNSLSGDIYHFSGYGAANPSGGEAAQQAGAIAGSGAGPFDWQTTYAAIEALIWYGNLLIRLGNEVEGQKYLDRARDILEADAQNFLDQPVPDEPCGWYLKVAIKYSEKVNLMVGGEMNAAFSDLLVDLADRCLGRGQIQYDHQLSMSSSGYTEQWTLTGLVDWYFTVLTYPYGDVSGSGTVILTRNGTGGECTFSCTASINVEVSGTLEADNDALLWINFELEEDWPELIYTWVCPDGSFDVTQSALGKQTVSLRLLLQEGWTESRPVTVAPVSGTQTYILHITRLP